MSNTDPKLNELVNALPEFYQPIYGHSEWDDKPLRSCEDRLSVIKKVYDEFSSKLQRPLRVLDLGCAQGFFSLNIAKWGGIVTGVDYRKQNVALCQFLASEHSDFNATFVRAKFEDFLVTIKENEYDLILCLSILHNVSRQIGMETVQKLMIDLNKKIGAGIFEFALRSPRAPFVPEDYREFLPGFSFIKEIAYCDHRDGSGIKRPVCFASDKFVYFENLGILKIDNITYNVHTYLSKKDVIHFHCGDKFVKFFNLNSKGQILKAQQELQFLKDLGGQNGLPQLLAFHEEEDKINKRLFIVRERIAGTPLSEKIASGEEIDRWDIIKQALKWMVYLESKGYYHVDVSPKNFICSAEGKLYPVDYETMRRSPVALIWPYKVNMLFFIFMNKILGALPEDTFLPDSIMPFEKLKRHLSQKQYEKILALEDSERFFVQLYEILFESENEDMLKANYKVADLELLLMGRYFTDADKKNKKTCKQIISQLEIMSKQMNSLTQILSEQQKRIEQLEKIISEKST